MGNGFYKASDASVSTRDWVALNFDSIPTEVVATLYSECPEDLERVDLTAGPVECVACDGLGSDDEGEDCPECEGQGYGPESDEPELSAWPVAWGTMFQADDDDDLREALISTGFVVYAPADGPYRGALLFGVDGGGYSFFGQHWIPLRANVAAYLERLPEIRPTLEAEARPEGDASRVAAICDHLMVTPWPV